MDDGEQAVGTDGEASPMAATTARPVTIYNGDLVKFKPMGGAHGDLGMAFPTAGEQLVHVLCADSTVVTRELRDLTIVDRGSRVNPGQVVALLSDPGGQAGVVTGVTTELDLIQLNGGEGELPAVVARGVSPGALRRVRELCHGDFVVSGPWLGVVVRLFLDVDVLFDDGAVCRVVDWTYGSNIRAKAEDEGCVQAMNSPYYPGQRVIAAGGQPSIFKACRWLNGCWNPSRVEGTVCKVTMARARVYWVASAQLGTNRALVRASAPSSYQPNIGNLTFFYSDATWGVADRCFFRSLHGRDDREEHAEAEFERPMCVADARTTVDVLWQDGTRQRGVPSASLEPFPVLNDHDFFPGERVVEDADFHDGEGGGEVRVGVVRSADSGDRTVRASWLKPWSPGCEERDETVSAYDFRRDDYDVFYGSVVVRLRPSPESAGVDDGGASTRAPVPAQGGKEVAAPATAAANDLSWVGIVVDLCDGHVLVRWGDGNTSKVLPHEIDVIRRQHVDELHEELLNWKKAPGERAQECATTNGDSTSTALIERQTDHGERDDESTDGSEGQDDDGEGAAADGDSGKEVKAAASDAAGSECSLHFQQFDVVQSPPDHHYLSDTEQGSGIGRKWTKRVQQEWKILENSLPETIYVRAFEDRMDLLRAAMVGAAGTPYQDGLFLFDIQLPPSYPAVPPQVYYHSFGLDLNHNLDKSGTVCLSLLDTFDGEGPELWSPANSTILQVLVSIQGLVLAEEPYYNEAGYEELLGTPEAARNAPPYAENAYLLTLSTMLRLLRRPPEGFEELVRGHFRRRGRSVLRACAEYVQQGCPVGSLDGEARVLERRSGERQCSKGFRLALAATMPQLVEAFTKIGVEECEQFERCPVLPSSTLSAF